VHQHTHQPGQLVEYLRDQRHVDDDGHAGK